MKTPKSTHNVMLLAALAAASLFNSNAQAQNLILDGDFSQVTNPAIGTNQYNGYATSVPDWTFQNSFPYWESTASLPSNPAGPNSLTPDNQGNTVNQFLQISAFGGAPQSISQDFNVVAGQTYTLSFDLASAIGSGNADITASITDVGGLGSTLLFQTGQVSNDQFYLNSTAGTLTNPFYGVSGVNDGTNAVLAGFVGSTIFTADQTGQVQLSFAAPTGNNGGYNAPDLANVDVQAVPEPTTWAMMLGGLALLAFRLRRKLAA